MFSIINDSFFFKMIHFHLKQVLFKERDLIRCYTCLCVCSLTSRVQLCATRGL